MLSSYPACFFNEGNGYSVIFPDLNGGTCGDTLDEAIDMAIDFLAVYLFWLKEDNQTILETSSIDTINPIDVISDLDYTFDDAFVKIISVDVEEYTKIH